MNKEYQPRMIHMRNVPGFPDMRALDAPLPCAMMDGSVDLIPTDTIWDGNSTPTLPIMQFLVPRHGHPIDSCEHDYRSHAAKNMKERRWADDQYRKGILHTPVARKEGTKGTINYYARKTWLGIQSIAGYTGVSVGAWFGIGSKF